MNRCALNDDPGGIACVFARTETAAFFGNVWPFASALLFLRGRLTFFRPDGSPSRTGANSGGPSVLIGFGEKAERRLMACADLGAVVKRVQANAGAVPRRGSDVGTSPLLGGNGGHDAG